MKDDSIQLPIRKEDVKLPGEEKPPNHLDDQEDLELSAEIRDAPTHKLASETITAQ